MGGDEFVLVCSEFNADELDILMKEICLKPNTIDEFIKMPQISISVGCAHSTAPFNIEELMRIADERMYEQKRKKEKGASVTKT